MRRLTAALAFTLSLLNGTVHAQDRKATPGITDTEIRIGQTMPYSGPASAYATVGRAHAAFFDMVNAKGGVNGRKIKLLSLDDSMVPPRALEQVRRLVEQEQVAFTFGILGLSNMAVQLYLNQKKVPHLFPAVAGRRFHEPKKAPWTMGWVPSFEFEARVYAEYLLKHKPDARIAVLYMNDDLGKEYLKGLKLGLGDKAAKMIVAEATHELFDPSVDSQIIQLKGSGADTLFMFTIPKFGTQTIRRVYELGWRPLHFTGYPAASIGATLAPAGLDKAVGLITAYFGKDPLDPEYANDADVKEFVEWMQTYIKGADLVDGAYGYAYMQGHLLLEVLRLCGDDLSRENIMRQAANLKGVRLPLTLPGVVIDTSPEDFRPITHLRLLRFDGKRWNYFGPLVNER
jgi:ABC-type branched-subunit amino acid transport system substrate-binding protein